MAGSMRFGWLIGWRRESVGSVASWVMGTAAWRLCTLRPGFEEPGSLTCQANDHQAHGFSGGLGWHLLVTVKRLKVWRHG